MSNGAVNAELNPVELVQAVQKLLWADRELHNLNRTKEAIESKQVSLSKYYSNLMLYITHNVRGDNVFIDGAGIVADFEKFEKENYEKKNE
jgi:hypothetical protein